MINDRRVDVKKALDKSEMARRGGGRGGGGGGGGWGGGRGGDSWGNNQGGSGGWGGECHLVTVSLKQGNCVH